MGFSDKMRESLGAEGARVEVSGADATVAPGQPAHATVRIHGGTRPAQIDALIVRLVEARRHWTDTAGATIDEAQAQSLPDRGDLMPVWTRTTVAESRVEVGHIVDASEEREIEVDLVVPDNCGETTPACAVTLHAQADIKGQIDPTGTTKIRIA